MFQILPLIHLKTIVLSDPSGFSHPVTPTSPLGGDYKGVKIDITVRVETVLMPTSVAGMCLSLPRPVKSDSLLAGSGTPIIAIDAKGNAKSRAGVRLG